MFVVAGWLKKHVGVAIEGCLKRARQAIVLPLVKILPEQVPIVRVHLLDWVAHGNDQAALWQVLLNALRRPVGGEVASGEFSPSYRQS